MAAARYVAMNPVRARLVERAEDWPWSTVGRIGRPRRRAGRGRAAAFALRRALRRPDRRGGGRGPGRGVAGTTGADAQAARAVERSSDRSRRSPAAIRGRGSAAADRGLRRSARTETPQSGNYVSVSAPGRSWRRPAGASPARVSRSGRSVASVAGRKATTAAKRTQQSCGVGY